MNKKGFFSNSLNIILVSILFVLVVGIGIVTYSIFKTDKEVVAIDFSNMSTSEVEKWASDNGIKDKLVIKYEYSETVEENKFISQNPKANEIITDKLVLVYSKGKDDSLEIEVPTITKTTKLNEIENWCKENGFKDVTIVYEDAEDIDKDIVLRLNVSGKVVRSTPIIIYVSSGGDLSKIEIEVTDFTGMSKEEVSTWAKAHTATIEFTYEYSSSVEAGKVISQSISAKTKITADKTIKVVISKGKGIEILDFPGDKKSTIQTWANNNNIKLEFIEEYSDSVEAGLCIKTDPTTGQYIEEGGTLTVYMSKGPKGTITVPDNLIGTKESEFVSKIKSLKLNPSKSSTTYFSKTIDAGCIYAYDDGTFSEGDTVNYSLSVGSYVFDANEYNNKTQNEAQYITSIYNARNAGISIKFNEIETSDHTVGRTYDCVSSNNTNIICKLAIASTYPVNNYVGKDEPCNSGESKCVVDGVTYKRNGEQYSDSIAQGKVISQSKKSGSVTKDQVITYIVSLGTKPVTKSYIAPFNVYRNGSTSCSTVDETKAYMNNQLSSFTNISYVTEDSDKTTGIILKIKVDGNEDYTAGDYSINTPIVITIAKRVN